MIDLTRYKKYYFFAKNYLKLSSSIIYDMLGLILTIFTIFLAYLVLPVSTGLYILVHRARFRMLLYIDDSIKEEYHDTKENLIIIYGSDSKKDFAEISKQALETKNLADAYFSDAFLLFSKKKKLIKKAQQLKIRNSSGVVIGKEERKIIFCHSHSGKEMILSIIKIAKETSPTSKTLLIQRGYSKTKYTLLKNIAQSLNDRAIEFYDPFEGSAINFVKKVKKSNIIHIYVDMPMHISLKNFSSTNIELFGREAVVNDGSARMLTAHNALCIPVYTTDTDVHLLKAVDPKEACCKDKEMQNRNIMQHIFSELSKKIIEYPEHWYMLGYMHLFFRETKFYEREKI